MTIEKVLNPSSYPRPHTPPPTQRHRYAGLVPIPWYDWRAATDSFVNLPDDDPARLEAVRGYLQRAFAEQGLDLDAYLLRPAAATAGAGAGKKRAAAAAGAAASGKGTRKRSSAKATAGSEETAAAVAPAPATPAPGAKRRGRPPKTKQPEAPPEQQDGASET